MATLLEPWILAAVSAVQTVALIVCAARTWKPVRLWHLSAAAATACFVCCMNPELFGCQGRPALSVILLLMYVFFYYVCFDVPLNESLFLEAQVRLANMLAMLVIGWANVLAMGRNGGAFVPRVPQDIPRAAINLTLLLTASCALTWALCRARLGRRLPRAMRGTIALLFQFVMLPLDMDRPPETSMREAAEFAFLAMVVFGVALAIVVSERAELKARQEAAEQQQRMQAEYYRSLSCALDECRRLRHDLNNYLAVQRHLPAGSDELTNALQDAAARFADVELSRNLYLNAVLYEKRRRAAERGVRLTCDCRLAETDDVPAAPLVSVVCNLLDNAIEACGEGDEVRLWAVAEKGLCVVRVTNPLHGRGLPEPGRPVRSPKGRGHGVGLRSVRRACEDNGGAFTLQQESGEAVATASIACAQRT